MKKFIVLCLTVTFVLLLTACGNREDRIKTRLYDFEDACQGLDVKGMLSCIDPSIARPVSNAMSLVGIFSDVNSDELIDKVFTLLFDDDVNPREYLSGIEFENMEIDSDRKSATVECLISAIISGERIEKKANVKMIKVDDEWYISGIRFVR